MRRTTSMGALSQLINGINAGYRMVKDVQSDEDDAAFRKEQRDRMRRQWSDEDALKVSMKDAAAPTSVEESTGTFQPSVDDEGNAMPPNPTTRYSAAGKQFASMADANKAATDYNSGVGVAGRQAAVLAKMGRPAEAAQLRAGARQEQVGEMQFANLLQDQERMKAFRSVGSALQKGGWAAVPQLYSQYNDGNTARVEEDGKGGATVYQVGPDGKELGKQHHRSLGDLFGLMVAHYDPKMWADRMDKSAEIGRQEDAAGKAEGWRQKEYDLRVDAEKRRAAHDAAVLKATQDRSTPAAASHWPAEAEKLVQTHFMGPKNADAKAFRFVKTVAMGASQANGGDYSMAIAKAMEQDARMRALAGGNEEKLTEMRNGYLDRLLAPPPAARTTPATPAAPQQQPSPQGRSAQPPRSDAEGDLGMFRDMDEAKLDYYVKAGNTLAKRVAKERTDRAALSEMATMREAMGRGFIPE